MMNDDDLMTTVRDSFTDVHSATPVERIVTRGRAVRARRRIPALAGVLAAGAAVAITATTLLPGQPSSQPGAQLAAWTVVKQANGTVDVRFHQLRDPARLQRILRKDGIPANVTFITGRHNPPYPCRSYGHPGLAKRVIQQPTKPERAGFPVVIIHLSALPSSAGVQIWFHIWANGAAVVGADLVVAGPGCTSGGGVSAS
jgi:hypothetical protein